MRRTTSTASWLAISGVVLLAQVSFGEALPSGDAAETLAVVAGRKITATEFREEWAKSGGAQRAGGFESLEARLEEMVRFELLFAAASEAGYAKKPEVQAAIRRLVVDRYMEDALLPALAAVTISDEEIEAYYRDHAAEFKEPAASRGALVQVTVPASASVEKRAELKQRAESARTEALALGPAVPTFGSVAVKYSDDQATRYRGGEMGWLSTDEPRNRWPRPLVAALVALEEPGAVSEVIESDAGYYVVKLIERRTERVRSLDKVRNRVRHVVHQEKVRRVKQELFDRLAGRMKLEIYPERLRSMPDLAEAPAVVPPANPN